MSRGEEGRKGIDEGQVRADLVTIQGVPKNIGIQ